MNVSQPGPPADDTKDPKQIAFEKWLYAGDNQNTARNWITNRARLNPSRVALEPSPRYNRRNRKLTVWMFVLTDRDEKVVTPEGAKKVKTTVKVSSPPPWVQ